MRKRMARQDKGHFRMFKAKILFDLVKKVFGNLNLDHSGSLDEISISRKPETHRRLDH